MGWFWSNKKRANAYLNDTGNWRFASLYKHDINLAVAQLERSHVFEMQNKQVAERPLGDWEAKGLVHFDYDGPLIPFRLSVGGPCYGETRLGQFFVERIQPFNDPNYPEEKKDNFLQLVAHVGDATGDVAAMFEQAMQYAAISRKRFFHVRLGKDAADPSAAAAQLTEQQYTESIPITRFVVSKWIQLPAPAVAKAWEDL